MNAPLTREEYLQVLMAHARKQPERSMALPAAAYRDPAESAKLANEKARRGAKPKKRR